MRPVKVLIYSINFAPELTGIGKYNGEMAEWLAGQGYEVRVITAPPYYPQWKVKEGYSGAKYAKEEWAPGVKVWRCPVWVPAKASGVKRLIHLASFAVSSLPVLIAQLFRRPDLLLAVEPPLVISPASVLLSKLFRTKTWLHVQDFEVDAAFDLGLLPQKPALKKAVLGMERWLMKRFDAVSSISPKMTEKLLSKGVPERKVRFFPNWVDTSAIYPLPEPVDDYRKQLGIAPDDIVFLYSGNMGAKQGLEIVLDAAERTKAITQIKFMMCGDGVAKEELVRQAGERKLDNIYFLPLQPTERLNALLNTADVHLLIQKGSASDLVMPSKLTGMLASGKPVLATADEGTSVHTVITESQAGITVPAEQAEKLADAVYTLSIERERRATLGSNARIYAEQRLSIESIMRDLDVAFKELLQKTENVHEGGIKVHG
ncbi:WcaI family glycosyltransferase [Paenibacillus elgii]|uniref:glycosyltransferase WbuB n=1 Tax=Paenibacillus elgii TaxID=189691 RepID=UPI002D7B3400|nr:WcaI family glycosyltransferase [Paenibacillus elgii]